MSKDLDAIRTASTDICLIKNLYSKWAKKKGVNYQKLLTLYVIYEMGACTQSDIVNYYGIPKQTINKITGLLMDSGMIVMEPNENEGRQKIMKYTEAGEEYAKSILEPLICLEDKVAAMLGEDNTRKLAELMDLYKEYMSEALEMEE